MNSAHRAPIRFSNGCQFTGSTSIVFLWNRTPESRSNHFFGAACPADVLLGFVSRDRQGVATLVASCRGARRATRDPVSSCLPPHLDVIEYVKLFLRDREPPAFHWLRFLCLGRTGLSQLLEKSAKVLLG